MQSQQVQTLCDLGSNPRSATEGEPGRAWASLLTSARLGVGFEFSRSPLMGDETTRWWSPSGKRVGVGGPWDSSSPSSAVESEPAGEQARFRKPVGASSLEIVTSALRSRMATTQLVDGACLIRS
jgi:hypothetical protein